MDRSELLRQLMETFKLELDEHVSTLNKGVLAMERGELSPEEKKEVVKELFRAAHSIKGSARAVELRDIEMVSHKMEDVFEGLKEQTLELSSDLADGLLRATDILSESMALYLRGSSLPHEIRRDIIAQLNPPLKNPGKGSAPVGEHQEPAAAGELAVAEAPEQDSGAPSSFESHERTAMEKATTFAWDREEETTEDFECITASDCHAIQSAGAETIRVATKKLDGLMAGMGQLLMSGMRMEQRMHEMKAVQVQFRKWEKSWRRVKPYKRAIRHHSGEYDLNAFMEFCDLNEQYLKEIRRKVDEISSCVENDYRHLTLLTDDLQDGVRQIRMVPVATLFDLFPRMIRDIGKDRGKLVQLRLEGTETEIDRQVLERLKDPLTHLLRNAVDHGIELPDVRRNQNKPGQGTITLKAHQLGNRIVIEISDDGAGIDLDAVRRMAVEKQLINPTDAEAMSPPETVNLIFSSGLSTQKTVTKLSGRGVGMDVVREQLEKLYGQVKITTERSKGTTFHLVLPLTLATCHVLMLSVAGETVAIPTTSVERVLSIDIEAVGSLEGKPAVTINGQALPLVSMARILELPDGGEGMEEDKKLSVVVLGAVEKRMAFQVERFIDDQEVVVKSLGCQLSGVRHIAGATLLGSGQVVMILNAGSMMQAAKDSAAGIYPVRLKMEKPVVKKILVVDDSITTRLLEKNILENRGYRVIQAADGMEGWNILQSESFDAVVFDIEMPHMNGLQLTEKVRQESRFDHLPIVLVTSLERSEDKVRGMEAGADAYITKGAFDQQELLETIERLIG